MVMYVTHIPPFCLECSEIAIQVTIKVTIKITIKITICMFFDILQNGYGDVYISPSSFLSGMLRNRHQNHHQSHHLYVMNILPKLIKMYVSHLPSFCL